MRNRTIARAAMTLVAIAALSGCPTTGDDATPSIVTSTFPANGAAGVASNISITATFNEDMDPTSIVGDNFTVTTGGSSVQGSVVYDLPSMKAVFAPSANLDFGARYVATVRTGVRDLAGNSPPVNYAWSFETAQAGAGPAPVRLGTASGYAILGKTAISTVPYSAVSGDVGLSPAAESLMTGFSQTKATGYSTSVQVTGFMYAADMAVPTPVNVATAVADMEAAYLDAAGRASPNYLNLGAGTVGTVTLAPGLYTWTTGVTIPTDITIAGHSNDVWIFQVEGDLALAAATRVIMSGGASSRNVYWQVKGEATLGTTSHFEGNLLCKTTIKVRTKATVNGRLLAQAQVTLDQNAVTKPAN